MELFILVCSPVLERTHAHNDATKDDVLVVKEGQWGTHANVELRLVSVAQAVSLAHSEHADFLVLDLERFVFESSSVDRGSELGCLAWRDLAHLNEHAFDNAMHFSVHI